MNKIKEFWDINREEIIDSVTNTKQSAKQKKNRIETEGKIRRERITIKIPLIMGFVYVLIGTALLENLMKNNLFLAEPQYAVYDLLNCPRTDSLDCP